MNTDLDHILSALQLGETQDWEFKSAKGGFPGSLWETYSAMANSEGGTIVLGVSEREGLAYADGLSPSNLAKYRKVLNDGANNRSVVNRNILSPADVQIATIASVNLLTIRIPRADRTSRPIHVGQNPFGATYRRSHEGDYRCSDAEVRRMLADADPVPADNRILNGFSLEDLDLPSLAQYRQRIRSARGDHPWLALGDQEFLLQLGGWRSDRASGEDGLTLAGLLMFGKDLAIRDPEAAPSYFVDYRERLDPDIRYTDRLYPDGTWEANLFQFYQKTMPKISAGIPTPFKLDGLERRDVTPAHESLREAFINALIHADFRGEGGIVIERHPDHFLLENPGILLVSLEQYHRGGTSECRNKALQTMFLLIGGGEHAGSGVARIRQGWASRHWRSPSLELTLQPDRVRLSLPMVSLIPEDALSGLRLFFGDDTDKFKAEELQAVATAYIERRVTNARLQELLDSHPSDITRMLIGLCERGYLISDNKRRWTSYRLNSPSENLELPFDSGHKIEDSGHNSDDFGHKHKSAAVLEDIGKTIADTGRASPMLVRQTITLLCAERFLQAEEIGTYLARNHEGIRKRYLSPMVAEGLLELLYPDAPNRPDQAYRVKQMASKPDTQ